MEILGCQRTVKDKVKGRSENMSASFLNHPLQSPLSEIRPLMKGKRKKVTRPPSRIETCLTLDSFLQWAPAPPSPPTTCWSCSGTDLLCVSLNFLCQDFRLFGAFFCSCVSVPQRQTYFWTIQKSVEQYYVPDHHPSLFWQLKNNYFLFFQTYLNFLHEHPHVDMM